jgi:hypothetical protein
MKKTYHVFVFLPSADHQQQAMKALRDCDYIAQCEVIDIISSLNHNSLLEVDFNHKKIHGISAKMEISINTHKEEFTIIDVLHEIYIKTSGLLISCHNNFSPSNASKYIDDLRNTYAMFEYQHPNYKPKALFNHKVVICDLNSYVPIDALLNTNPLLDCRVPPFMCGHKLFNEENLIIDDSTSESIEEAKLKQIQRFELHLKRYEKEEKYEECAKLLEIIKEMKSECSYYNDK